MGVLTDGKIWYAWRWRNEDSSRIRNWSIEGITPPGPVELIQRILPLLTEGEPMGKPWIPADPVQVFQAYPTKLRDIYVSLEG